MFISNKFPGSILLSAQRGFNISRLKEVLLDYYEKNFIVEELILPVTKSKLVSQIHSLADVIDTKYDDFNVTLKFRTDTATANKIRGIVNEAAGISN